MPLETVRVSKRDRDHLIKLKRLTRIETWNVLCRWAFCVSLAEPTPPRVERVPADSPIEMTWRTFGGENASLYMALLKQRCRRDGLDLSEATLSEQFRLHLHRGIGYLAGDPDVRDIVGLASKALATSTPDEEREEDDSTA